MSILVYGLLFIIVGPRLSDAMADSRQSQIGHVVPYMVQHSDENLKAGPPCFCIGTTCYYCRPNTYCTIDRAGCCPRPGCRNHCGRWCLCPGYPICCPDGACPGDYPKCCGKICCKKDGNCCGGEHCCDAKRSCCGKGCCPKDNGICCTPKKSKTKYCCVKKNLEVENSAPKNEEDERNGRLGAMNTDEDIFRYLCKTFQASVQYAVLVVGRLSDTYKLEPQPPKPSPYTQGRCFGDNYAAAMFTGGQHTEYIILDQAEDLINKYKGKYHQNPELFLFSKNSPCCGSPLSPTCNAGCAGKIRATLTEVSGSIASMTIAWDNNYKLGAMPFDKAFLFSLNSMLSPGNALLSWNLNGYCRLSSRKWFQRAMFGCLASIALEHPFCSSAIADSDLAKLINKVTWICGTRSITEDDYNPDEPVQGYDVYDDEAFEDERAGIQSRPARDPECWKNHVSSFDKYKCSQLPDKAYECAKKHNAEDLGPALSPINPATFSNSAADVRGEYGGLCFQHGSCTAQTQEKLKTDESEEMETKNEL